MSDDESALAPVTRGDLATVSPADVEPAAVYVKSLPSARSRLVAIESLRRAARIFGVDSKRKDPDCWRLVPWARIGPRETTFLQAELVEHTAPNTAKVTMSMVRGVLRTAFRLGRTTAEQYHRAIDTPKIRGKRLRSGRMLSRDEISILQAYIRTLPTHYRAMVGAIFACALGAGLRRDELARLQTDALSDVSTLKVLGKGAKWRAQPVPTWTTGRVSSWLDVRRELGIVCPSLFVRLSPESFTDAPLSVWGVWKVITETGKGAGLAPFTPHDLRRTYATRMIEEHDLGMAKTLMGHSDASTTALYDRRGEKEAAAAVNVIEDWGDRSEPVKDLVHPTTGQPLVNRRRVVSIAYRRDGKPADMKWLRAQVNALRVRRITDASIAQVLLKLGVRRGDGVSVDASDVVKL